jgi:Xaa-Pro aminopeptidase
MSEISAIAEHAGPARPVDRMLLAREKTREAIGQIAARVQPGMREEEAVEMATGVLEQMGLEAGSRPARVRFGRNTARLAQQPPAPRVELRQSDIFFVDIAPSFNAYAGDGAASFVVGIDGVYECCARDAKRLFREVRDVWCRQRRSGADLYAHAQRQARLMGWELNPDMSGHRLPGFGHGETGATSLAALQSTPRSLDWVMQIHLGDRLKRFGAFYADVLIDDDLYG